MSDVIRKDSFRLPLSSMESEEAAFLLEKWFSDIKNEFPHYSYLIAFSGGVDSAVLAAAAVSAQKKGLIDRLSAIMAVGPVGTEQEPREAKLLSQEIGIPLEFFVADDLADPLFVRNDTLRCYYCKRRRFSAMIQWAKTRCELFFLLDGSNADDMSDYRPGTRAVQELGLKSPLAEKNINKQTIRRLAHYWNLSVADKPSNPCLATRIAYDLPLTDARLRRIEKGEQFLAEKGFSPCRLRMDADYLARVELAADQLDRMNSPVCRKETVDYLRQLGFEQVSLDLEGFQSGKMNRTIRG